MRTFLEKKYVMIVMVAIIFLMIGVIIYCLFFTNNSGKITYDDYTILEGHTGKIEQYDSSHVVEGYKGDGKTAYYINGQITASKNKHFTIITFNLYDNSDNILGTAVAGLNEVKKGKIYDFKAISLIESSNLTRIKYYKIKDIKNMEVK